MYVFMYYGIRSSVLAFFIDVFRYVFGIDFVIYLCVCLSCVSFVCCSVCIHVVRFVLYLFR